MREFILAAVVVAVLAQVGPSPSPVDLRKALKRSRGTALPVAPLPATRAYVKFTLSQLCGHGTCCHFIPWWSFKLDGRSDPPVAVASALQGSKTVRSLSRRLSRAEFEKMVSEIERIYSTSREESKDKYPYYSALIMKTSLPMNLRGEDQSCSTGRLKEEEILQWLDTVPVFADLEKALAPERRGCEEL